VMTFNFLVMTFNFLVMTFNFLVMRVIYKFNAQICQQINLYLK
ncbi:hypothetical protein SS7213T_07677, partial [Staphylococcus simiae CCM 7213 = CCUG 51256]